METHHRANNSPPLFLILSQINPVDVSPFCFPNIPSNAILKSTHRSPTLYRCFRFPYPKPTPRMLQAAPICQYHSTNAPHSFIHLSPTLHNLSNWERRLTTRRDTKRKKHSQGSTCARHTCAFAVSQHQKAFKRPVRHMEHFVRLITRDETVPTCAIT